MSELIEYTTAERLAAVYGDAVDKLWRAVAEVEAQTTRLANAFDGSSSAYTFGLDLSYRSNRADEKTIRKGMKLAAWACILEKIGIWRVLSAKRADELRRALDGKSEDTFPEINPETIVAVARGYASSANEFLEEAVTEEYDFWKPSKHYADYKRNSDWKINRKIIRPYIVTTKYSGGFECHYHNRSHVMALDNIFHMLAGLGSIEGYRGPLVDGISGSKDGVGQTDFFKFRCYMNGNIHLEFKRPDLLALFNTIAGRNRLAHDKATC